MRALIAKRRRQEAGFTLIELLVVLAILGMLVALATPQVLKYLDRAKVETASIEVKNLQGALDLYLLDVGHYPTQQEGLAALVQNPGGLPSWRGPYLKTNQLPKDPWGNDYQYRIPGQNGDYDVYSLGSSGTGHR